MSASLIKKTDFLIQMIHSDPELRKEFESSQTTNPQALQQPAAHHAAVPQGGPVFQQQQQQQPVYYMPGPRGTVPKPFVNSVGPLVTVRMNEGFYNNSKGTNSEDDEEEGSGSSDDIF